MDRAVLFGERKLNNPRRLTVKQAEVLAFMWDFYKENDQLPTCEAIAIHFNFRSANAAYEHCLAMQRRGYLERNALGKFKFASHVHQCMVTCPVSGTGYDTELRAATTRPVAA